MGKKETQDTVGIIFQDPKYIPETRPLHRNLPPARVPVVVQKSYPNDYPNACIENGIRFFSTDDGYEIDVHNNIYFKDPDTRESLYLHKIDTTSYTHKMYAEFILNDLCPCASTVKVPGTDRDTTVYARGGVRLYSDADINVKSHAKRTTSAIEFNMNFRNGLPSNLYEIQSLCRHETIHLRDYAIAKAKNKQYENISPLSHAEDVYKVQMTYEEFRKAPIEFQRGQIRTYVHFVIKGCWEKYIRQARVMQSRYFDNFNRDLGELLDASITYDKTRSEKTLKETLNISFEIKIKGLSEDVTIKKVIEDKKEE